MQILRNKQKKQTAFWAGPASCTGNDSRSAPSRGRSAGSAHIQVFFYLQLPDFCDII